MSWEKDLEQVGKDPAAGARLLLTAADYLRRGEALPSELAEFFAGALEVAAHKQTEAERVKMLGRELGLVRERVGRPEKATVEDAERIDLAVRFSNGTRAEIVQALKASYGASPSTAARLLKKLKDRREQDIEALFADCGAWREGASQEQLDAYMITDDTLDHDEAVQVLVALGLREASCSGEVLSDTTIRRLAAWLLL